MKQGENTAVGHQVLWKDESMVFIYFLYIWRSSAEMIIYNHL